MIIRTIVFTLFALVDLLVGYSTFRYKLKTQELFAYGKCKLYAGYEIQADDEMPGYNLFICNQRKGERFHIKNIEEDFMKTTYTTEEHVFICNNLMGTIKIQQPKAKEVTA